MTPIVLTPDQSRQWETALDPIEIHDAKGHVVGKVIPPTLARVIEQAKQPRDPNERTYTSAQVQAHLKALEVEWERTGGFDEKYMYAFLDRLRDEDAK